MAQKPKKTHTLKITATFATSVFPEGSGIGQEEPTPILGSKAVEELTTDWQIPRLTTIMAVDYPTEVYFEGLTTYTKAGLKAKKASHTLKVKAIFNKPIVQDAAVKEVNSLAWTNCFTFYGNDEPGYPDGYRIPKIEPYKVEK